MAIQDLSGPRIIATRPAPSRSVQATPGSAPAARPEDRPSLAAAPGQPAQTAERHGGFLDRLRTFGHRVADWLLAPVARIGVREFVVPDQRNPDSAPPGSLGLPYKDLSFRSKDGTPLKGWYIPADRPSDRTVVLAHGHGSQMGKEMKLFAPWLHAAGYNVVAFDFRNSGGSGGDRTTMGFEERWDLAAAIDQAQANGAKKIAVLGVSMGAATAIAEAAGDKRVNAVISDCSFDTLHNAVATRVRKTTFDVGPFHGLHIPLPEPVTRAIIRRSERVTGHTAGDKGGALDTVEPLRMVPGLGDRPLFLIHGAADTSTPPEASKALAKADPAARLWLVPGAGHAASYQTAPEEYQARVLSFLGDSL